MFIYIHKRDLIRAVAIEIIEKEPTTYPLWVGIERQQTLQTAVCVCNFWFVHSTYKKGGSFIISTLSYSFSTSWLDSMRTDKKIRKEAKISLKLLTYFISSFVYFVVVDVVFFSAVLSLFCMCDDVIFLSDDGRRRRRLHHSRCSSLALFFQFFL